MTTLNIQIFVDAVALLSGAPQSQAVHLFDDSGAGRENQGAPTLVSSVLPGQLVRWTVNAIDVQSQVWIKSIAFGPAPVSEAPDDTDDDAPEAPAAEAEFDAEPWNMLPPPSDGPVWGKRFEGYIPYEILPGFPYPYRVDLCFGAANGPIITIEGPALRFVLPPAHCADGIDASGLI